MRKPKVLFIDAYDSFTNNIVSLLETELFVEVEQIKIDHVVPDFPSFLKQFTAVVAGPGPGHPANLQDVGLFRNLWNLGEEDVLPVFGICLGFQSLVHAFGGEVLPLRNPRHGVESEVTSKGTSIFRGLRSIFSVQYHSLQAILGHASQGLVLSASEHIWRASKHCPDLEPLAWDLNKAAKSHHSNEPVEPILMAVKHVLKPFYGIQFHPESVCSQPEAKAIVKNWWEDVQGWYRMEKKIHPSCVKLLQLSSPPSNDILEEPWISASSSVHWPSPCSSDVSSYSSSSTDMSLLSLEGNADATWNRPLTLYSRQVSLRDLSIPNISKALHIPAGDCIILDSENRQMPEVGRYSIIGVISPDTVYHMYSVGSKGVHVKTASSTDVQDLLCYGHDIFQYLKSIVEEHVVIGGSPETPFWGGLMGYITYEACLETIDVPSQTLRIDQPDVCFTFVERSIVVDHEKQTIYVQSIKKDDQGWVGSTVNTLAKIQPLRDTDFQATTCAKPPLFAYTSSIEPPHEPSYESKILACKDLINIGESYELCLTNQAIVRQSYEASCPWSLYLALRQLNPAPFGAYLRLGPLILLSSSPERFMSWTRPNSHAASTSTCQFRPIKGTVQKRQVGPDGQSRTISLEEATKQLSTTKERAENLMIVDLIRHDLHGVVGSGNVTVKKLMVVEEYETMFQLVSVIEGELRASPEQLATNKHNTQHAAKTGIDVLAASLPPGSMTGAPKKRSCQLLRSIEGEQPRSVYSGVVGYMSVGGGGDFSVVIRSMFSWDSGQKERDWHIGAGGAVTTLSTEEGEWQEMWAKLQSTIRVFQNEAGESKDS